MGGCNRRKAAGGKPKERRIAPTAPLPQAEEVRQAWLYAVQNNDAAFAGKCARFCETLEGAELFAHTDGLDAFVAVAMGQSMDGGQGGLMVALAQALMRQMDDYKMAVFEVLAAAAHWPSLRGRIAGSGVLGVVTATLLAPHQPPSAKALMARLAGMLTTDSPDVAALGDPKRAEEFAKIRGQLISSNAVAVIVRMTRKGSEASVVTAAAGAVAALAVQKDEAMRSALIQANASGALLTHLGVELPEEPAPEMNSVPNMFAEGPGTEVSAEGAVAEGAASEDAAADAPPSKLDGSSAGVAPGDSEAATKDADDDAESNGSDDASFGLAPALHAMVALFRAEGPSADMLRAPLLEAGIAERLQGVVREVSSEAQAVEAALRCLVALLRSGWKDDLEEMLVADLARLIVTGRGEGAVAELLLALLNDKDRIAKLGDLQPLRRAVTANAQGKGKLAEAKKLLDAVRSCEHCGKPTAQVMRCGGCQKAEYCSRECQKLAWKTHKVVCPAAKKK